MVLIATSAAATLFVCTCRTTRAGQHACPPLIRSQGNSFWGIKGVGNRICGISMHCNCVTIAATMVLLLLLLLLLLLPLLLLTSIRLVRCKPGEAQHPSKPQDTECSHR